MARKPMEITILKPRITGQWTRTGKNIKWRCRIYQRIGQWQNCIAVGCWSYKPKAAYKDAICKSRDTSFATAIARIIGPNA